MKKEKSRLCFLVAVILLAVCVFNTVSCQNKEFEDTSESMSASHYMPSMRQNVLNFINSDWLIPTDSIKNQTRAVDVVGWDSSRAIPVYVSGNKDLGPLPSLASPANLFELIRTTEVKLRLISDSTCIDTIYVSESKCSEALEPLVQESKNYLYAKGFTELEIQQMLAEKGADESELLPFVIAVAEEEEYFANNLANQSSTRAVQIDWAKVGACSFYALGGAFITELRKTGATVLTKAVLKQAFKATATRLSGVVGAAIFIYDFSKCYW